MVEEVRNFKVFATAIESCNWRESTAKGKFSEANSLAFSGIIPLFPVVFGLQEKSTKAVAKARKMVFMEFRFVNLNIAKNRPKIERFWNYW